MWRNSDELMHAFRSGDPEQVADALAALDASIAGLEALVLAAPDPCVLDAFAGPLPEHIAEAYLRVVLRGEYFTPPLSTG